MPLFALVLVFGESDFDDELWSPDHLVLPVSWVVVKISLYRRYFPSIMYTCALKFEPSYIMARHLFA